ncbi:thermolabile L-asparaginase [Hypoxylon trugodes]|uniref:thermolabile L-asparaginase n=1 Tax=Hypoxylon trugodes TaxID=326681 RepID=UPI0021A1F39C|nr:thermolabile L-asparaginase [Hypoxylon trugodes]KAI1387591.1 thermolabile L-asparaginase [Hypoxylon trugodes]
MGNILFNGDFVVSNRSGIVENRHLVNAAVVDATGKLLHTLGDPSRMTIIRSAAKPVQAIPLVESGGMEQFGFDDADLALMCGSHNSEDRHIERAKAMLIKSGVQESDLQCGGHQSINPAVTRAWIQKGFVPTPIYSACSGNHIGVIAGAKAIGASAVNYHTLDHLIQNRIGSIMEDLTGLSSDEVKWALDGCNMYSPATPLQSLALTYASFAQAVDDVEKDGDSVSLRTQAMARIYNAMVQYPENVAGEGRFCTSLIEAYGGALIGKGGGDGCYAIGVRESQQTRRLGAKGAIGIALKVEDGNYAIMDPTAVELLEQLQIGTAEIRRRLGHFHRGQIKNSAGVVTGHLSFPFKLRAT